jgi:hypothetical protein
MNASITIRRATADDAQEVAVMVGELLAEIMDVIGEQAFNFDLAETTADLKTSSAMGNTSCLSPAAGA